MPYKVKSNDLHLFREFDQAVMKKYDTVPLKDLGEIKIGSENSIQFYNRIVRSTKNIKQFEYSDFKLFDELDFISKDIKYYTALLYFFRPNITDSSISGTYHKTLEDRRYMMFASVGYQSIYNYWNRIGNLLDKFFKTGLPDNSIYFSRVLNNFPQQYKNSHNYQWLNNTYNSEIKNFLSQRDDIVHSYQLECDFYWRFLNSMNDKDQLSHIQEEKESSPKNSNIK